MQKSIDGLISDSIGSGVDINPINEPETRKMLEANIAPSEATYRKYASIFLAGRQANVTFDDIMNVVRTEAQEDITS